MTTVNIKISPDCKHVIVKTTGNAGNGALTFFNNGEQVADFSIVYSVNTNGCVPQITTFSRLLSEITASPGILTVKASDNASDIDGCQGNSPPGQSSASVLVSCELDCCLAKKVLALSKCDCDSKCDEALAEAKRLHLYIQSINTLFTQMGTSVSINVGIESQAIEVYNQANNLCLTSCGCNC